MLSRKTVMAVTAGILTMLVAVIPSASARTAAKSAASQPVTIGFVNWTEAVAVTHLMQLVAKEKLHRDVRLELVGVEDAFSGVANGKLDAFLDVWLPETHADYWKKYGDKVVDLGPWYAGRATLGIAVPFYSQAQSIADLATHADAFGHRIVGIQKGSGVMRITRDKVMPGYGLDDFELTSGDTSALIEAVDKAIHFRKPIAITAWKPHWLFAAYPMRYLDDPKNLLDQRDQLHAIARKGLKQDAPLVYALLDSFRLNEKQLADLELTVANSRSAWGGVRKWMARNEKLVSKWVSAATPSRSDYLY